MLKRKITDTICEWKVDPQHKPLIIKGPRQCGKTFSVLDFAKNNYKNIIYLNFFENQSYKARIRECFRSIPKQLAKENKKFQYSVIKKGSTASSFAGCLQWIEDAGIIARCYNLSITELPLDGNAIPEIFKVYMRDTGLLVAMLDEGTAEDIMDGNLGIYKGAIYENIIADILAKNGRKLYYFEKNSTIEIDFFIRYKRKATAVEVKSAEKATSKSMTSIIKNYGVEKGIKLSTKNVSGNEIVENYPLYMAMFLDGR